MLKIIKDSEETIMPGPDRASLESLFGPHFDPAVFGIRAIRRRLYDYERNIGEVLHVFYER